jgi:pullulanase
MSISVRKFLSVFVALAMAIGVGSAAKAAAIPDTLHIKVHYNRDAGDYAGYNLFLWKNMTTGTDGSVTANPDFGTASTDAFGPYVTADIPGMTGFDNLGFIVRYSATPGAWTSKDVTADRFMTNWDSNGNVEIWLKQADPTIYTTVQVVTPPSPKLLSATIDDFRKITVTLNQPLTLSGSGDEGFSLDNGLSVSSVTSADNANPTTKVVLNLGQDIVFGTTYKLSSSTYSVGSQKTVAVGNIYNSDGFNSRYTYTGNDLGATYGLTHTDFRVWAPTASAVYLNTYLWPSQSKAQHKLAMTRDVNGTWIYSLEGDNDGLIYTYTAVINGHSNEAVDPYATSVTVNGTRAVVTDPAATDPTDGWAAKPEFSGKAVDATIYEMHIRDLSMDASSGIPAAHKGKFLALTDTNTSYTKVTKVVNAKTKKTTTTRTTVKTGVAAIKDLGVSHVQLLPIYDYLSGGNETDPHFNWGYDPLNYNAPEGQYSTDPTNPWSRVRELKQAVNSLHQQGLRTVMDVVYNHVASPDDFSMNLLVPGYFFRTNPANGDYYNATGCGNEVASERPMVRKFIVDSVSHWARDYHIDGFRFDLMGVLDVTTMQEVRTALNAIDPSIIIIGEGWNMGAALPANAAATQGQSGNLSGIGFFNDQFRDAVKGSVFNKSEAGYVNGAASVKHDDAKIGLLGNTGTTGALVGNWTAYDPGQSVNYVEAHDNLTLFDKLKASMPSAKPAAIIAADKMAASFLFLSQGLPFMQAGQEFMRSKNGDDNSYQSSDAVNSLKWSTQVANADVRNYYKGLIALRKAHPAFRMDTSAKIASDIGSWTPGSTDALGYLINGSSVGDSWSSIYVAFNGTNKPVTITLPSGGNWTIAVNAAKSGVASLGTVTGTKLVIPAGTSMVLHK